MISHFPSPVGENENCDDDPFFKQVVEVSCDGKGEVTAVAWSPGEKACGEVAVSLANCIGVFSHSSRG